MTPERIVPTTTSPTAGEVFGVPSTDGCDIALRFLGGHGPPLMIGHATGFHGAVYQPMANALADRFAVWAVDLRGHGGSTAPSSGDFAWTGMAEDLLACVDAIDPGAPIAAVGHSMGGSAILLAQRARPGTFSAAYLFEPIVMPEEYLRGRRESPMSGPARRRRAVFGSKAEALHRYAGRPPLSRLRADALYAYVEHGFVELDDGTVRLACEPEHEAMTFECESKITLDQLQGIDLPVTVAAGADEPGPNPARFAPAIVDALAGAVLVRYEQLTHFGPFEAPELIAGDVIRAVADPMAG